ncbi:MAG: hypothetical protein JO124_04350 [Hyphomicrobiales bacterium]|nr:hypothetical protein [Hyphomicrobiales bacterium]MBV9590397.1 hypothetical protein [Hyphomicrobiales bacterium]
MPQGFPDELSFANRSGAIGLANTDGHRQIFKPLGTIDMEKMTGKKIFLPILFVIAIDTSSMQDQVWAQDTICQSNCVKNYNTCIGQCGGTRAAMPWEPVAKDKLTTINDCVRSQCRDPLNTCRSDCSKSGTGRKLR